MSIFRRQPDRIDEAIRITPDGAAIVNAQKLFQTEKVQRLVREMRAKINFVDAEPSDPEVETPELKDR